MGVVDGDIGMQGLHICVLQPLYLELILHVGPVYIHKQSGGASLARVNFIPQITTKNRNMSHPASPIPK